jgi:hypothetical protein
MYTAWLEIVGICFEIINQESNLKLVAHSRLWAMKTENNTRKCNVYLQLNRHSHHFVTCCCYCAGLACTVNSRGAVHAVTDTCRLRESLWRRKVFFYCKTTKYCNILLILQNCQFNSHNLRTCVTWCEQLDLMKLYFQKLQFGKLV